MAQRKSFGTPLATNLPVFVNNTIAANNAINGGAVSFAATAIFLNNIIAENSSGLFRLPITNDLILQTNCIVFNAQYDYANLSSGLNNLAVNPQFIASGVDNFHLLATSPCINAGSNGASNWLAVEPARVQGLDLDLGAFELSSGDAPIFLSPSILSDSSQIVLSLTGMSGECYLIESSSDLIHWDSMATNFTANGFFLISDSILGITNRFYRAIHLP